jgi:hypothetical protein
LCVILLIHLHLPKLAWLGVVQVQKSQTTYAAASIFYYVKYFVDPRERSCRDSCGVEVLQKVETEKNQWSLARAGWQSEYFVVNVLKPYGVWLGGTAY